MYSLSPLFFLFVQAEFTLCVYALRYTVLSRDCVYTSRLCYFIALPCFLASYPPQMPVFISMLVSVRSWNTKLTAYHRHVLNPKITMSNMYAPWVATFPPAEGRYQNQGHECYLMYASKYRRHARYKATVCRSLSLRNSPVFLASFIRQGDAECVWR